MADDILLNLPTVPGGQTVATMDVAGKQHEKIINEFLDGGGNPVMVSATDPLPVTDAIAEGALLSLVTGQQSDALTDTELRATPIDVNITGGSGGATTIADGADVVEGTLADAAVVTDANGTISGKLRGLVKLLAAWIGTLGQKTMANSAPVVIASDQSAIPISGTVTTGGLTDVQLRATPVPISGTVSTGLTQPLTDTQLRATPVPISGTVAVTGAGDATAAKQDTQITAEQGIRAAVEIMDDWDESDRAKVNLIAGQVGILGGTGTDAANVPRITLATNVALPAGNNNIGDVDIATLPALAAGSAIIGKVGIDQTTPGTTNLVRAGATQKPSIGATVVLAVTALQSLASSGTVGWKSVRTSNLATLANDYEVFISLSTAATSPANDKAVYLFVIPWYTTDAGSTWFSSSGGTATLPTSADATYTIASPHNFRLLGVLNYSTISMTLQDTFLLSNCFGNRLPDGFSFCVINFTGAALGTGCVLDISPINDTLV